MSARVQAPTPDLSHRVQVIICRSEMKIKPTFHRCTRVKDREVQNKFATDAFPVGRSTSRLLVPICQTGPAIARWSKKNPWEALEEKVKGSD